MSGFPTIEGVSSKMKGPEKLLWYAASAAKARSMSAASVLLAPTAAVKALLFPWRACSFLKVSLFTLEMRLA